MPALLKFDTLIIIASKEGQFANRVLHFAHILAFCRVNHIRLVHPFFREFKPLFPALAGQEKLLLPGDNPGGRLLAKMVNWLARLLIKINCRNLGFLEVIQYERYDQDAPEYDLSAPACKAKARKKILLLYGWLFRDNSNFTLQKQDLKNLFTIAAAYRHSAESKLAEIKKAGTLVGVHIRRGDYQWFEGGRWFYPDAVYAEKMNELAYQLKDQAVTFILCSNEKPDLANFAGLRVYHFRDHFLVDFLLLSATDYIIGPPSTFSALAAYWNDIPIQFIEHQQTKIDLTTFSLCQKV